MINFKKRPFPGFKESLDKICSSRKSRAVILPIIHQRGNIEARVLEYLRNRYKLENLDRYDFNPDISPQLKDCYESMPRELKSMMAVLHNNLLKGLHVCPYCLLSEPDTKDHYLPKEDFPEFSFLACNLVPCCSNCNRRKGKRWLKNGERIFYNPFFDAEPERVLAVELSLTNLEVRFYLLRDEGILVSHIKSLGIIERYNEQGIGLVSQIIGLLDYYEDIDNENFKNEMRREYIKSTMRYGKNYYASLIFESLMMSGFE